MGFPKTKKPGALFHKKGNPAVRMGPVAFRPRLSTGLARFCSQLSGRERKKSPDAKENSLSGLSGPGMMSAGRLSTLCHICSCIFCRKIITPVLMQCKIAATEKITGPDRYSNYVVMLEASFQA
jgi:hypothetical protein